MSNISVFELPTSLDIGLTEYAQRVFEKPNQFIINGLYNPNNRPLVNIEDPNVPGTNDDFIFNHDLNSVNWKVPGDLHTCVYKWLYDVSFPPVEVSVELFDFLEKITGKTYVAHRGNFYYPHTGYMGWHTNSDVPGTRIYIAYSEEQNGSYFKYVDRTEDTPRIVTDWDNKGWTVRMFQPSANPKEYLWHCVGAPHSARMSFGFLFQ